MLRRWNYGYDPLIEREPDLTTGDSKNFLLSYYRYTNLANLFLSIR